MSDLIGFDEEFDDYYEYGCGDPYCEICHPDYDDVGTFIEEMEEE